MADNTERYKFVNYTGRTLRTRVTNLSDSVARQFVVIKPNDEVVLEERHGERLGLTKKSYVVDNEEKSNNELNYPQNLTIVNGVGKKTAQDLGEQFLTEEELKNALSSGEDIGLDEKIQNNLKNHYNIGG